MHSVLRHHLQVAFLHAQRDQGIQFVGLRLQYPNGGREAVATTMPPPWAIASFSQGIQDRNNGVVYRGPVSSAHR